MQLWDLDNILPGSRNTQTNESGVIDSDDDEMDVDGKRWFAIDCPWVKTWYGYWKSMYMLCFNLCGQLCREQEKEWACCRWFEQLLCRFIGLFTSVMTLLVHLRDFLPNQYIQTDAGATWWTTWSLVKAGDDGLGPMMQQNTACVF